MSNHVGVGRPKVGIVGAGRMGLQISRLATSHGFSVRVASGELALLVDCDLVLETVPENLAVKQHVFRGIEQVVSPESILLTNTSSLLVSDIARGLRYPERLVGMHFFNPVAKMRLVEVVPGVQTSDTVLETAMRLAVALGKTTVIVRDSPGFVVNRLLMLVLAIADAAIGNGTDTEVVAGAMRQLGLPLSLDELTDLIGAKTLRQVQVTLARQLGERYSPNYFMARFINDAASLHHQMRTAIESEIDLMLAESVVPTRRQITQCLLLGAGWRLA